MNSFDRYNAILKGEKPDKMPFYFPTIACSVASEILGRKVKTGADSLHFAEEMSWLDGANAHEEFVCKHREDVLELNRKLRADIVRETWRCKSRPDKKLDDYTLLFGREDGPHIIKRFFPEQQSYGVLEDTVGPQDSDELKEKLLKEMKKGTKITEDELENTYQDQLIFKKMADPYFPTIAGGIALGIPMYSIAWLEATVLEPELLAEYFMYRAEIGIQHVK